MRSSHLFYLRRIMSLSIPGFFILAITLTLATIGLSGGMSRSMDALLPFPGPEPKTLPATLEVENFDRGGEGIGYHELAGVTGSGIYRNRPVEGVDIQAFAGASGGFVVNEAFAGEWLSYTIFSEIEGSYEVGIRYASEFRNGTFHVEIDGKNVTGAMTVAATGPNFRSLFKKVDLAAGKHILRIVMDENSIDPETAAPSVNICNFDSISFRMLKNQLGGVINSAKSVETQLEKFENDTAAFSLGLFVPEIPHFEIF